MKEVKEHIEGPMGLQYDGSEKIAPEAMPSGIWYPTRLIEGGDDGITAFAKERSLKLLSYGPDYTGYGLAMYRWSPDDRHWRWIAGDGLYTPDEEYILIEE